MKLILLIVLSYSNKTKLTVSDNSSDDKNLMLNILNDILSEEEVINSFDSDEKWYKREL